MKDLKVFYISLILIFLSVHLVFAGSELNISSNKMEVFESEGLAVFNGNVFAKKGDLKIWCDKMYVYYLNQGGKKVVTKIIALGRVIIEKGDWKAYANKAVYFKKQEKLVLEDNPKVWRGKSLIEGDTIIVYFNEGRSEILSKKQGRVRAVINF